MKRKNNGVRAISGAKTIWALVISAIVTIALVVTCALCFNGGRRATVNGADAGDVTQSASGYSNVTSTTFSTNVTNNTYRPGDYVDYSYNGGVYTVTLAAGTYRLEAWGAAGGNDGAVGGKGGYTFAEYSVTSATTIYIVVGGQGATGVSGTGGGYNGGGNAGPAGSSGGGGGATHFSLTSGVLTTAAVKTNALIVAGGAGGGGNSYTGSVGHCRGGDGGGGNNAGTNAAGSTGGTLTAAGTGAANASGSQGGHRSGGNNDGGGGGGGYFGGGASGGDGGGAGGSGYIKSGLLHGGGSNGQRSGHGLARITYICKNSSLGQATSFNANTIVPGQYAQYTDNKIHAVSLPIGTYRFEVFGGKGGNDGNIGGNGGYSYGEYTVTAAGTYYVVPGGLGGTSVANTGGGYNGGGNAGPSGSSGGGGGASHIGTTNALLTASKTGVLIVAGGGGGAGNSQQPVNGGVGGGGNAAGGDGNGCKGGSTTAAGTGSNAGSGAQGGHKTGDGGGGGGGWFGGGAAAGDGGGGGGSGYIASSLVASGGASGVRADRGLVRIAVVNAAPINSTGNTTPKTIDNSYARGAVSINLAPSTIAKDPEGQAVYFSNGTNNSFDACTSVQLYLDAACTKAATDYVEWTAAATPANAGTSLKITKIKRYPRSGVDYQDTNGKLKLYVKVRDNFYSSARRGCAAIPFYITVTNNPITVKGDAEYTYNNGDGAYTYRLGNANKTGSGNIEVDYTAAGTGIFNPNGTGTSYKTVFITAPLTQWRKNGFTIKASDIYTDKDSPTYDIVGIKSVASSSYTAYYTVTTTTDSATAGLYSAITIKPTTTQPTETVVVAVKLTAQQSEVGSKAIIGSDNTDVTLVFKIMNTRPYMNTATPNTAKKNEKLVTLDLTSANRYADVSVADIVNDPDKATTSAITFAQTTEDGQGSVKVPKNEYVSVTKEGTLIGLETVSGTPTNYNKGSKTATTAKTGEAGDADGIWASTYTADWYGGGMSKYSRVVAKAGTDAAKYAWLTYSYVNTTTIRFTAMAASQYMYKTEGRLGDFYVLVRLKDTGDTKDYGMWYPVAIKINSAAPRDTATSANFTLGFNGAGGQNTTNPDGNAGNPTTNDESAYKTVILSPISYNISDGTGGTRTIALGCDNVAQVDEQVNGEPRNICTAQPFLVDDDVFTYETKKRATDTTFVPEGQKELNEIVALAGTTVETAISLNNTSAFFSVELIPLYTHKTVFGQLTAAQRDKLNIKELTNDDTTNEDEKNSYYKFYGIKLMAVASTDDKYLQIGVKVKDSHSFETGSTSADAATNADGAKEIRVFVKVQNRNVMLRRKVSGSDITAYPVNETADAQKGVYTVDASQPTNYITYTIKTDDTIYITPYDLAYDFDSAGSVTHSKDAAGRITTSTYNTDNYINAGGVFNSNPTDAGFNNTSADPAERGMYQKAIVDNNYNVKYVESPVTSVTASKADYVSRGYLTFTDTAKLVNTADEFKDYMTVACVNSFTYGAGLNATPFKMPCITVTGKSRTTANLPIFRFSVTDGRSTVEFAISVIVANAKPELRTDLNDYYKLTASIVPEHEVNTLSTINSTDEYKARQFRAEDLAWDRDEWLEDSEKKHDRITFVAGSAKAVVIDQVDGVDTPFERFYIDGAGNYHGTQLFNYYKEAGTEDVYVATNENHGAHNEPVYPTTPVSDYISTSIQSGTGDFVGNSVLYVEGLSSTQIIKLPVCALFKITDNYRADEGVSTLWVPFEVINSPFKMETKELKVESDKTYTWNMQYIVATQKRAARYIVNDADLFNSDAIKATDTNKLLLFSDVDSRQTVLLNTPLDKARPAEGQAPLVHYTESAVTGGAMNAGAAVQITSTYQYTSGSTTTYKNIDVSIEFYTRDNVTGRFSLYDPTATDKLSDQKYWAIKLVDNTGDGDEGVRTQISISVKDDHDKADVYDGPRTTSDEGNTARKIENLFYKYQTPGIRAMHEYYRTMGNTEAESLIREYPEDDDNHTGTNKQDYIVDIDYVDNDTDFVKSGYVSGNQDSLKTTTFADNFEYMYFIDLCDVDTGKVDDKGDHIYETVSTPKVFSSFAYKPLTLSGAGTVKFPMSYVAMPTTYVPYNPSNVGTTGTDRKGSQKIIFSNMEEYTDKYHYTGNDAFKYYKWGSTTENIGGTSTTKNNLEWMVDSANKAAISEKVFQNVTLSDSMGGKWTGAEIFSNSQPYIDIEFVTDLLGVGHESGDNSYINYDRSSLEAGSKYTRKNTGFTSSSATNGYYEDKYGFSIKRKGTSARLAGKLTLTFELKVLQGDGNCKLAETASVDIYITNGKPTIDGGDELKSYNVSMKSSAAGTTVRLAKGTNTTSGVTNITYTDPDSTDIVKFLMPLSSNKKLSETAGVTDGILGHIDFTGKVNTAVDDTSHVSYVTDINGKAWDSHTSGDTNYIGDLIPNPGYENFFTVSPADGVRESVQIIPKHKTSLNISKPADSDPDYTTKIAAYNAKLKSMNLAEDVDGKIYYPFKMVAFDDCDGSGFENGYWKLIIIKVYIENDELTSSAKNDTVDTIKLTKGMPYTYNVLGILSDADIDLTASEKAIHADDATWASDAKFVTEDKLVMPVSGGVVQFTAYEGSGSSRTLITGEDLADLPVKIEPHATSKDTLVFTATSAFTTKKTFEMTFKDTALPTPSTKTISFVVTYTNEAPTKNADTYGTKQTLDIVMRRGDSFTLLAADVKDFAADRAGHMISVGLYDALVTAGKYPGAYTTEDDDTQTPPVKVSTAKHLADTFLWYTADNYNANEVAAKGGSLGSLIMGSDDAPSTIRISGIYRLNNDNNYVTTGISGISLSYPCGKIAAETPGADASYPAITITAESVVTNFELYAMLYDTVKPSGKECLTTAVPIRVTVLPTAPNVKSTLPAGMTKVAGEEDTYSIELEYGQSFVKQLNTFMEDVDSGDEYKMFIPEEFSTGMFSIENPEGIMAIEADCYPTSTTAGNSGDYALKITATDFIPIKPGDVAPYDTAYSAVKFCVADEHGATSKPITIRVYVKPNDARSAKAKFEDDAVVVRVNSYVDYLANGTVKTLDVVSGDAATAQIVYDKDVSAPSAQYEVYVYALIEETSHRALSVAEFSRKTNPSDYLLIKVYGDGDFDSNIGKDVYEYVTQFFSLSLTGDGKQLTIVPKAAIIAANGSLDNIKLYIEVKKHYNQGTGAAEKTMAAAPAVIKVIVENSRPIEVGNTSKNFGYPEVGKGDDATLRDDEFLSFTGIVGDTVTWDVVVSDATDEDQKDYGLFYDYDMLNVRNSKEKLVISKWEVDKAALTNVNEKAGNVTENFIDGDDPVLKIEPNTAKTQLTITINRKVKNECRISKNGEYLPIVLPIKVYCADATGVSSKQYTVTTITVNIQNDPVTFKEITIADGLGYTMSGSDIEGYDLYMSIPKDKWVTVNVEDFIKDKDIDFDRYTLAKTPMSNSLEAAATDNPGTISKKGETLFTYYTVNRPNDYGYNRLNTITFTCKSAKRGEEAVCYMAISDSEVDSSIVTIHLVVGNTAPEAKAAEKLNITVMGMKPITSTAAVDTLVFKDNIVNYVTDVNPDDCLDVTKVSAEEPKPSHTYVYIDNFVLYTYNTAIEDADRPSMYGPNAPTVEENPDATVCNVGWIESDTHQMFGISVVPGIYGTQKVMLKVYDGGYKDGENIVTDELPLELELTITVVCPIDSEELASFGIAEKVIRKVTPELLLKKAEGEFKADGYVISKIEKTGNLAVHEPKGATQSAFSVQESAYNAETDWGVEALARGGSEDALIVTFTVGGKSIDPITIPVNVTENHRPELRRPEGKEIFSKTSPEMREGNIVTITPDMWFVDEDIDDVIRFVPSVKVKVSAYATATLNVPNNTIDIKFKGRGETTLTLNVSDRSNHVYTYNVIIGCSDMEELGVWGSFVASIEERPLMYGLIFGGILLLIILLIIILIVIHKRRQMRREIEALLSSEAELNEEMLRLSGGMGSTMYQSYGYLPPTTQAMNDPGLMLGGGASAPNVNSLQLGVGTGQTAGITTDITTTIKFDSAPGTPAQSVPGAPAQSVPGTQQQPPVAPDGFDPDNF